MLSINSAFNGIHGKITIILAGPAVAIAALGPTSTPASAQTTQPGRTAGPPATKPLTSQPPTLPGAWAAGNPGQGGTGADRAASGAGTHRAGSGRPAAVRSAGRIVLTARHKRWGGGPRGIAKRLLVHHFHWRRWQFRYLNLLWDRESGWNSRARNPRSGAYGIPQAVPGSKMASAGPDWQWNARTQIRWGMRYIKARYRTPYWAWQHELRCGWY